MRKVKFFCGAIILISVMGINFSKSNAEASQRSISLGYFSNVSMASTEIEGWSSDPVITRPCVCPFVGGNCKCWFPD